MGRPGTENRSSPVISRVCVAALAALGAAASASCYSTGDGTSPPLDQLYFPVGLQVSAGGGVLYVVNSDFDLQYNGGTLQSYDLQLIRENTLDIIADPTAQNVPILQRDELGANPCPQRASAAPPLTLGQTCAPPVDSSVYVRDTAVIGAFATDLLLSKPPAELVTQAPGPVVAPGTRRWDRLFTPVRGNASVTWASVERDDPNAFVPPNKGDFYAPFLLHCGQDNVGRCDGAHAAGNDPNETNNSRHITMPGEPFGIAISEDGSAAVVTHQSVQETSLLDTGLTRGQMDAPGDDAAPHPSLQFILEGVPLGGIGLTAVPHDPDAFPVGTPFPRAAFLQTSNFVPEVDLLRQYPDELGGASAMSSLQRPFLDREAAFTISVGPSNSDSRGIAIDPTPRLACKAKVNASAAGRMPADVARDLLDCAQTPARVFIANRAPASLLIGEIGGSNTSDADYDPDRLLLHGSVPLSAGPSRLYLAPVIERDGAYALRVFVVCFDSATLFVYDPDTEQVESIIRVGLGPFSMAFDPFSFEDVATNAQVPFDTRVASDRGLRRYRFAYLASFTNSFIQVIDLDNAQPKRDSFETVVFQLGRPTTPKGS
jgi:hypothetical protein